MRLRSIVGLAVVLLLSSAATAWRLTALEQPFSHPDEPIAVAVVGRVLKDETLDTNWIRGDVPAQFRTDQYNFSAYFLFLAGVEAATAHLLAEPPVDLLERARVTSTVLGGLVVLLTACLGTVLGGSTAGVLAALLTGVCVTLFQDSLYVRPEAFASVLVLALFLVGIASNRRASWRLFVAGLILGVLVATKVSFLLLVPFVIVALAVLPEQVKIGTRWWLLGLAAFSTGFAAGAPYAALNPDEYMRGIAFLREQYAGGHWPHGVHDGTTLDRLRHSAGYVVYVIGSSALLLACIGLTRLLIERRLAAVILVVGVLASAAYFLQTPTFFERNLSHALPVLLVLSALGTNEVGLRMALGRTGFGVTIAAILGTAVAFPAASITWKLVDEPARLARARAMDSVEAALSAEGVLLADLGYSFWRVDELKAWICGPVVFKLTDYGDRYVARMLEAVVATGRFRILRRIHGPFHGAPTSTLQTYHHADVVYLAVVGGNGGAPCALRFEPMRRPEAFEELDAAIQLWGAATLGGLPAGEDRLQWVRPVYSTWAGSDENVGEIYYGPFRACRDAIFPVVGGMGPEVTRLRIAEDTGSGWHYVHDGPIPQFREGQSLVRLPVARGECRSLWVGVIDHGKEWGQWVGIGEPVRVADEP